MHGDSDLTSGSNLRADELAILAERGKRLIDISR